MPEALVPLHQPSYRYLAIVYIPQCFIVSLCTEHIHTKTMLLKSRSSHGGSAGSCVHLSESQSAFCIHS